MGYADLIQQRLQTLTEQKQAEVYDFVEFIASRGPSPSAVESTPNNQILAALASARSAWPGPSMAGSGQIAADMRAEWDGRAWQSGS